MATALALPAAVADAVLHGEKLGEPDALRVAFALFGNASVPLVESVAEPVAQDEFEAADEGEAESEANDLVPDALVLPASETEGFAEGISDTLLFAEPVGARCAVPDTLADAPAEGAERNDVLALTDCVAEKAALLDAAALALGVSEALVQPEAAKEALGVSEAAPLFELQPEAVSEPLAVAQGEALPDSDSVAVPFALALALLLGCEAEAVADAQAEPVALALAEPPAALAAAPPLREDECVADGVSVAETVTDTAAGPVTVPLALGEGDTLREPQAEAEADCVIVIEEVAVFSASVALGVESKDAVDASDVLTVTV